MNKNIKILQIIRGLDIGGDSGGAELFGVKLARELSKLPNCDVRICAFYSVKTNTEQEWCEQLNAEGINTFFVSEWYGYNNLRRFIQGLINLSTKIKSEKFDVCHSHFQLGTLAALIIKIFGYTKTAYRTSHIRKEWNLGKWSWFLSNVFIHRLFPKYLDGEIGVSKAVCTYLLQRDKKIDQNKIHLIYNGVDIEKVQISSKKVLAQDDPANIEENKYAVGCVGRLTEQKGYPYIFNAMPNILQQIPDCILQVVGDGELRSELTQMVDDLELTNHIQFLGLRNDVPALLRKWNIFILPSLWEGLPTVVMEAMICGVPIIATDIPGTNELVIHKKTGLLVPPKNPHALAESVIMIRNNIALRTNLINHAKKHVKIFGMKNIAGEYFNLFQRNLAFPKK